MDGWLLAWVSMDDVVIGVSMGGLRMDKCMDRCLDGCMGG